MQIKNHDNCDTLLYDIRNTKLSISPIPTVYETCYYNMSLCCILPLITCMYIILYVDPVVKIDSPPTFITTKSLDADFASLLLHVCDILNCSTDKEKSLKKCKEYLRTHIGVISKNPPLSKQNIYEVIKCINFNELLENIKEYMSWEEHSILDQIVEQCESPKAKKEVSEFERILAFCQGSEIICTTAESEISTKFVKFFIVIDRPYKQLTMKEYLEIKSYIVKLLKLHPCVLKKFCKLLYDPLYMEWLVSVELIDHISKMVRQERDIIIRQDVVLVQIGEYEIIKEVRYSNVYL